MSKEYNGDHAAMMCKRAEAEMNDRLIGVIRSIPAKEQEKMFRVGSTIDSTHVSPMELECRKVFRDIYYKLLNNIKAHKVDNDWIIYKDRTKSEEETLLFFELRKSSLDVHRNGKSYLLKLYLKTDPATNELVVYQDKEYKNELWRLPKWENN